LLDAEPMFAASNTLTELACSLLLADSTRLALCCNQRLARLKLYTFAD
jgi:hypothetical protein